MTEEERMFIEGCLVMQEEGVVISSMEHHRFIRLLDVGLVGMDGFKYCWPEVARENHKIFLESQRKVNYGNSTLSLG